MPQTSYSRNFSAPYSGTLGDAGPHRVGSYLNNSGADMFAGTAVAEGTEGLMTNLAAATDRIAGIVVNSMAYNPTGITVAGAGLKAGDMANVLEEGAIWVKIEEAMAVGDDVYCRITSDGGSNTVTGRFRKSNDSGRAILMKGARVIMGGASGATALIHFSKSVQGQKGDEVELVFDQASASATATKKEFVTRADRFFVIDSVGYTNVTGLAADNTNFFDIELKQGTTSVAIHTTNVAGGAVAANTPEELVMAAAANRVVPPGTILSSVLTLHGTQTLPAGRMMVRGRYV